MSLSQVSKNYSLLNKPFDLDLCDLCVFIIIFYFYYLLLLFIFLYNNNNNNNEFNARFVFR